MSGLANKRVLVAIDGSEASLRALDTGVELARALHGSLELVSVVDVAAQESFGSLVSDEQYAKTEQWVRDHILLVANNRVPANGPRVSLRVMRGHPVQVLLELADKDDVALLCVGRTGKSTLQKVLEGSVSKRLTRLSPVPVVIVG